MKTDRIFMVALAAIYALAVGIFWQDLEWEVNALFVFGAVGSACAAFFA